MFIPIGDENPTEKTPYVTYSLIALNVFLFFMWCFPMDRLEQTVPSLALHPNRADWLAPDWWKTIFTSMFMHAGLLHLIGNMLFLWIFGDNVEDKMGHAPFAVFYLACGIAADIFHVGTAGGSAIPTLGASGAVSGALGAYIVFFPRHKVRMLVWFYFFIHTFLVPAVFWIGIWFAEQIFMSYLTSRQTESAGVAYWAHIGGFVLGLAVAAPWKYILYPARFGISGAGRSIPAEFLASSRRTDRATPLQRPLVTLHASPDIEFVDSSDVKFAVLRTEGHLDHVLTMANLVAPISGEKPAAVRDRLNRTRGMIASGLTRERADRIRWALQKANIGSMVIPMSGAAAFPPRITPDRLLWDDAGIAYVFDGAAQRIPWKAPILVLAAVVGRTTVMDIVLNSRRTLRITPATPLQRMRDGRTGSTPAQMTDLAEAVIVMRDGVALNEGVRTLAHHGHWGWLAFTDAKDYEDYAFWAYNIVMTRRPVFRI